MTGLLKKATLAAALGATAMTGALATPAYADGYRGGHHGDGAGVAIAAGILGIAAIAAIASSGHHDEDYRGAVAYGPPGGCFEAYPGYDGYCYPASYYINAGWAWRDGHWWHGGERYERPFDYGWRHGEGYRDGWRHGDGYRGDGYRGEGYRDGWRHGDGYRGDGYRDGGRGDGFRGGEGEHGFRGGDYRGR